MDPLKNIFQSEQFKKTKKWFNYAIGIVFFGSIALGVASYIENPDSSIIPNFVQNLTIASLALAAFSMAFATLVNHTPKKGMNSEAMRYRHNAETLLNSAIYLLFSYFFWLNKNTFSNLSLQNTILKTSYVVFSVIFEMIMYFAIIIGILLLTWGMYCLLKENL